jgi:hypothetical protein
MILSGQWEFGSESSSGDACDQTQPVMIVRIFYSQACSLLCAVSKVTVVL